MEPGEPGGPRVAGEPMVPAPSYRLSDHDREQAVTDLRDHLLDGRLTLEEFAERVGLALRAGVTSDLEVLRADLPSHAAAILRSPRRRTRITLGLLAHVVRRGRLRLGRRVVAVSVLSDIDLDLREASIEDPSTSLTIFALVGNADVYVPEGIDVDVGGLTVVGHRRDWGREIGVPEAPSLRIRVFGLVSTVDVWRVPPGVGGDYGAVVTAVRRAHRSRALPGRGETLPGGGETSS